MPKGVYKRTEAHRQKIAESHIGLHPTEKTRQKMSMTRKGNKNSIQHGETHTRLYRIWHGMKQRTLNSNDKDYENYGSRGITICPEWTNDYIKFRDWALSHGYADDLVIDRIENNGNYEPSNCQWITVLESNRNKRNTINMQIAKEIRDLWDTGDYTYKQLEEKYRTSNIYKIINFIDWIE